MKAKFKKGDLVYFQWNKEDWKTVGVVVGLPTPDEGLAMLVNTKCILRAKTREYDGPNQGYVATWGLSGPPNHATVYPMDKETLDEIYFLGGSINES